MDWFTIIVSGLIGYLFGRLHPMAMRMVAYVHGAGPKPEGSII